MRTLLRHPVVFALLTISFAACGATPSGPTRKTPVAVAAGATIYEDELLERVQSDLMKLRNQEHQVKQRALENLILQRLLDGEAKKRGGTVEQLLQQEVEAKVADPTEAELNAYFEAQKGTFGQPSDAVRTETRKALRQSRVRAARQVYFQQLWDAANVSILLPPPRIEVAHDPARVRGNPNAPVMIVEFSDFQCPFCRRVQPTLTALLRRYPDKVALSYRDFPLREIHPQAQGAAEAARCAGDQGKFWEYHDRLFAEGTAFDRPALLGHAQALGLDAKTFEACVDSGRYRAAVEADVEAANRAGVAGTPAFFINGVFLDGAQPITQFEKVVDAELALKKP